MKLHTQLDSGSDLPSGRPRPRRRTHAGAAGAWSCNPALCTIGRRLDERASPCVHDVLCIPWRLIDRYVGDGAGPFGLPGRGDRTGSTKWPREPSEGWNHEEEPDEKYSCADDLADEGEPEQVSILSFTATAAIPSRVGVVPCLCPKSHRPRVPMTRRLPSIRVRSREPAAR